MYGHTYMFSFFFNLTYSRWTSSFTILPVVTKDLPISTRFTPYDFLSRCKFSTLTTRQPMVEFYLLTFTRFPLRKKKHKSYFGKNWTHDFRTTSRCADCLLEHSGDEGCIYDVCMVITYSRVWINRVRLPILLVVSWTGKMNISLYPCVPENLVSRDGFSRPVSRQPAHLHTQANNKCIDHTRKVAHPARCQLYREN